MISVISDREMSLVSLIEADTATSIFTKSADSKTSLPEIVSPFLSLISSALVGEQSEAVMASAVRRKVKEDRFNIIGDSVSLGRG